MEEGNRFSNSVTFLTDEGCDELEPLLDDKKPAKIYFNEYGAPFFHAFVKNLPPKLRDPLEIFPAEKSTVVKNDCSNISKEAKALFLESDEEYADICSQLQEQNRKQVTVCFFLIRTT